MATLGIINTLLCYRNPALQYPSFLFCQLRLVKSKIEEVKNRTSFYWQKWMNKPEYKMFYLIPYSSPFLFLPEPPEFCVGLVCVFHPLAVQCGSVPALSFSVITHFGPDNVWKPRLLWPSEARIHGVKRERKEMEHLQQWQHWSQ